MLRGMKMLHKFLFLLVLISVVGSAGLAEEEKIQLTNTEMNFYYGMFDFSYDGKSSAIFGFQHQNENLLRDSFLGHFLQ